MRQVPLYTVIYVVVMCIGFMVLAWQAEPRPVSCDGHACIMQDGSFRLDPREKHRWHPETQEYN